VSSKRGLVSVDFRSPSRPVVLFEEEAWASLECAGKQSIVSGPSCEALLDVRQPLRTVQRVPGGGSRLLQAPHCQSVDGCNVFAGTSTWEGQIRLHCYQRGEASPPLSIFQASQRDRGEWLRAAQGWVGGKEGCTGLAVVPHSSQKVVTVVAQTTRGDVLVYPMALPASLLDDDDSLSASSVQARSSLGVRVIESHPPASGPTGLSHSEERDHVGLFVKSSVASVKEPTASVHLPSASEDMLRRCDVFALRPCELRVDRPRLPREPVFTAVPRAQASSADDLYPLLSRLVEERLRGPSSLSLHEAARCLQSYLPPAHVVTAKEARQALLSGRAVALGVEERYLPLREALDRHTLRAAYGDELVVQREAEGGEEDGGCVCGEEAVPEAGCGRRSCWVPHCLVYRVEQAKSNDEGAGGRGGGSVLSDDLRVLLMAQWDAVNW